MIGVKVGEVVKAGGTQTIRTLGRVAADETRIFRLSTGTDGWIRDISSATAGSLVQKDQTLASYYAPEFLATQQGYLYALERSAGTRPRGRRRWTRSGRRRSACSRPANSLENLGMSGRQIDEIAKTRELAQKIDVVSPADAFVLARNVNAGQRFEKGFELYRLADLSHVWILADLFEREGQDVRPGQVAKVSLPYLGKSYSAKVSDVPPQFDPATRTLKVRLEMDNPGFVLRPEMFVDVEFTGALSAPTLDRPGGRRPRSGLRQTVYVETEPGVFEPRRVEAGRSFGDRVEIVKGLMPGERIVLSGNFLVDSESRMKAAAAGGVRGGRESSKDPSAAWTWTRRRPAPPARTSQHGGATYYFCSEGCKKEFDAEPREAHGRHEGRRAGPWLKRSSIFPPTTS